MIIRQQDGFTLIEIMTVLLIFGMIFSVARLSLGDFGLTWQARSSAEQFQQVIRYFREQAIITASNYAIETYSTGYQIRQLNTASQQTMPISNRLTSHVFPSQIVTHPNCVIEIQATGEITPFQLTFGTSKKAKLAVLIGQANGMLKMSPP